MKNKIVAVALCVLMTAGVLAGCGTGSEEGGSETGSDEGKVTLEILSLKTEEGPQAAFQEMFDNYTKEHPEVTFDIQSMSSDDLKTTLRARSASGDMPDIITWMKEVETDFMVDLSGEDFLNNINQDTLEGANAIYDEGTYAMPIDNGYIGLYYNKGVLEENGLSAPTTYDELVNCCETLQANGVTPFAISLSDLSVPYNSLIGLFAETVFGQNPNWIEERDNGEHLIVDDPGWKTAFDIVKNVIYKYGDPDNAYNQTGDDCAAMLVNGEAAFYGNGSWSLSSIREVGPDANIGLMAFPVSDNPDDAKLLCFPDTALSICADSDNIDEAKDFLAYVSSEEAGQIWSENVKVSSAVNNVNVDYDPIASDIDAYLSGGNFTPYGDRVLRSVFTDKLWEIYSYYMLGETDWDSLASELDTYWDKAQEEEASTETAE